MMKPDRRLRAQARKAIRGLIASKSPCERCAGRGYVYSATAEGAYYRARREVAKLSLRAVARAAGLTVNYLSDAELGRRPWNARLRDAYRRL